MRILEELNHLPLNFKSSKQPKPQSMKLIKESECKAFHIRNLTRELDTLVEEINNIDTQINLNKKYVDTVSDVIKESNKIIILVGNEALKEKNKEIKKLFDFECFKENPVKFFTFLRDFASKKQKVPETYKFIKILQNKILRVYTENVYGYESMLDLENVVYLNGNLDTAFCTQCNIKYDGVNALKHIRNREIPLCVECSSIIIPDIGYSGISLLDLKKLEADLKEGDLLLILGSSFFSKFSNKLVKPYSIYINDCFDKQLYDISVFENCNVVTRLLRKNKHSKAFNL